MQIFKNGYTFERLREHLPLPGSKVKGYKMVSRIETFLSVYKRLKTGRERKCHNFVVDWRVAGRSRISRDVGWRV